MEQGFLFLLLHSIEQSPSVTQPAEKLVLSHKLLLAVSKVPCSVDHGRIRPLSRLSNVCRLAPKSALKAQRLAIMRPTRPAGKTAITLPHLA
jgi:hypothetical protein